ncbi:MAG: phage protease [Bacteroidia bacterium]|nr:phage protease [Bacteroidia bacterium]
MAKQLYNLFKKHGLLPADADESKLKDLEKDLDGIEDSLAKPVAPAKPADKPAEGAAVAALPPEVLADLESLKNTVGELTSGLKVVVDATKAGQAERTAQEAAAQKQKYVDHVAKLVAEGRITKAQSDEYLKPENAEKYGKALDVFIDTTSQLPVNPALKGAGTQGVQPRSEESKGGERRSYSPNDAHAERKALEDAALQEIIDGMAGKV